MSGGIVCRRLPAGGENNLPLSVWPLAGLVRRYRPARGGSSRPNGKHSRRRRNAMKIGIGYDEFVVILKDTRFPMEVLFRSIWARFVLFYFTLPF